MPKCSLTRRVSRVPCLMSRAANRYRSGGRSAGYSRDDASPRSTSPATCSRCNASLAWV